MKKAANKVSKVNFRTKVLQLTKENLIKRSSITKKDLFHEILLNSTGMDRQEIVFELAMKVLKNDGFNIDSEDYSQEDLDKFNKVYKTCKNSVDTIVSKSNNGATYWMDKRFSEFELIRENHLFRIQKKAVK